MEELIRIELDERMVRIALSNVKRALNQQADQTRSDLSRANSEIERINKKLWKLREMYMDGMIDDEEEYNQHMKALKREKEQAQILATTSDLSIEEAGQSAENAARFIHHARKGFLEGTVDMKREIVGALATGYKFYGREKRLEIDLNPLLAALVRYTHSIELGSNTASLNGSMASFEGSMMSDADGVQPEVRVCQDSEMSRFELAKIGSKSTKNAPAKEAFFVGGPPRARLELQQVTNEISLALQELVALLSTQHFPRLGWMQEEGVLPC